MADWDKIASTVKKEEEEEKPEGDAGLQKVISSPALNHSLDMRAQSCCLSCCGYDRSCCFWSGA